jgi:hypothetical protein
VSDSLGREHEKTSLERFGGIENIPAADLEDSEQILPSPDFLESGRRVLG